MGPTTTSNGPDDPIARRAAELFTGLSTLVSVAVLPPERMARWAWRQPHEPDEDKELLPVMWADVADWLRDVAEHLARLAKADA